MEGINKRSIGKLIVKFCGNEGQKDDETLVVTLRRILKALSRNLTQRARKHGAMLKLSYTIRRGMIFASLNRESHIGVTALRRRRRKRRSSNLSKKRTHPIHKRKNRRQLKVKQMTLDLQKQ